MRPVALLCLLLAAGCRPATPAVESVTLHGAGSTFVEPIVRVWAVYYREETGERVEVNYQGKGSGAGISEMTRRLADFGCTDHPMNARQVAEARDTGGDVLHVPLVVGAIVPIYNLPDLPADAPPVEFTGEVLADLYLGKITNWSDPRLQELNPKVTLPDLAVQPVTRADPSGTSFVFVDYLSKVSPEVLAAVGVSNLPNWPKGVGIAQSRTDGVAGYVSRTPGAVGYVELTFAAENPEVPFGRVRNRAGNSVLASPAGIAAAAASPLDARPAEEPYSLHALTRNLTDAPGPEAYPIVGTSYAVLYRSQPGRNGPATRDFLRWALGPTGQKLAGKRHYAPLPEPLRVAALAQLDRIEFTP